MIYSFFGVNKEGSIQILDPYLDLGTNWGRGYIAKFNALKIDNPQLKTIAAVGGWNEGSQGFSQVILQNFVSVQIVINTYQHNSSGNL